MPTPTTGRFSPAASLRAIRTGHPLIHQITNYVVMNETANITLAIGASPVMAHALAEVEEMAGYAGALVLNIGTLSTPWIEAMLLAGRAANAAGVPVVLDPVGAGATSFRTETAKRILDQVDVTVIRGNAGEVATLIGEQAEMRGVDSLGAASPAEEIARSAAAALGCVVAVTGPVDRISDGERGFRAANGHSLLGLLVDDSIVVVENIARFRRQCYAPLEAATEALAAYGVAAEDAAAGANGPGSFHAALYDGLYNLDPDTLDSRVHIS